MILFPAIDLKDGAVVRLVKGEMDQATVYNENPGETARGFADIGFSWVHVVDLDGAVAGKSENEEAVDNILWCLGDKAKVQLGGGIRNRASIDNWLEKGVARVILGTAAVRHPELVREAAEAYPGQIAVGLDARHGKVAIEGWLETSEQDPTEMAKSFEDAGVAAIVYTDIDRDGVLTGVNWEATIALADAVSVPVIASGGLASMADIERLTRPDARKLAGAITGRALYDGRIDAQKALAMLAGSEGLTSRAELQ
jgi:phosphoribosylformimino-5-aminoimidazole carboxamide ribotide isomerase